MADPPEPYHRPPSLNDTRRLLTRHGIRPRKSLGQHFLVDETVLARIVEAAELSPTDVVLEVGPGLGVLTRALAEKAGRVVAVEIDAAMRTILAETTRDCANVTIVPGDILSLSPAEAAGLPAGAAGPLPGFKVVANLPYYITSAVTRHMLSASVRPELLVLTIQKEVADRILSRPGDMSVLAVSVQFYAQPRRIADVPAKAFYPPPKVDSTVLRLDVLAAPPVPLPEGGEAAFFRAVKAGFGQRRKQLKNSLSGGLGMPVDAVLAALSRADIDPRRRAETLTLAEWSALARSLERGSARSTGASSQ